MDRIKHIKIKWVRWLSLVVGMEDDAPGKSFFDSISMDGQRKQGRPRSQMIDVLCSWTRLTHAYSAKEDITYLIWYFQLLSLIT